MARAPRGTDSRPGGPTTGGGMSPKHLITVAAPMPKRVPGSATQPKIAHKTAKNATIPQINKYYILSNL
ncbi:MAG: hypothetical protein QM674_05950 [Burkholderiaceae bacterium]